VRSYLPRTFPDTTTRRTLTSLAFAALSVFLCVLYLEELTHTARFRNVDRFALQFQSVVPLFLLFSASFAIGLRLRVLSYRLVAAATLAALYPLWLFLSVE